jgi:Protein of unknown function (DUF3168)
VSAIRPILEAVVAVLAADATLATLITGVFNDVPDQQAFPYVLVRTATERGMHTLGGAAVGLGWNNVIRVHVYSRYQGDLEALQILERVVALLNFAALTVTGYTHVTCEYANAGAVARVLVEDVDKVETRHIPAEFRVRVR